MPLVFTSAGVDLGNAIVRLGKVPPLVSSLEQGIVATGSLPIDDPAGSLNLFGLKDFHVDESSANPIRVFSGYTADATISRTQGESLLTGGARRWSVNLVDLNAKLGFSVKRTPNANRPAESDATRITWLLSYGNYFDNGLVDLTNPVQLDAVNYVGEFDFGILSAAAAASGKNFGLYYEPSNGQTSLYYLKFDSTLATSTMKISNVLADVDQVTTFYPLKDARLWRDPSKLYSGAFVQGTGVSAYGFNATTAATYGARDTEINNSRIGRQATAQYYADQAVAAANTPDDRITVTVKLPAAHVNDLREGQRLQVKFTHLPNYTSFSYIRCVRRTVEQNEESDQFYNVTYELLNENVWAFSSTTGGGTPGGTVPPPIPPPPTGGGGSTGASPDCQIFDDFNRTVGVGWGAASSGAAWTSSGASPHFSVDGSSGVGWGTATELADSTIFSAYPYDVHVKFYLPYVAVDYTDSRAVGMNIYLRANPVVSGQNNAFSIFPRSGGLSVNTCPDPTDFRFSGWSIITGFGGGGSQTGCVYSTAWHVGWYHMRMSVTAGVFKGKVWADGDGEPDYQVTVNNIVPDTLNQIGIQPLASQASDAWKIDYIQVSCPTVTGPPGGGTVGGQPANDEFIANGDGVTTQFHTASPYISGSLTVRVDGLGQPITEVDPTKGTFTLAFAPTPGERITATYTVLAGATTFGQRPPQASQLSYSGQSNLTISNLYFNGFSNVALVLSNCTNVIVEDCDFNNTVGGIYAVNCTNVTVRRCRFLNIGNGTIGSGHSNYVQFNNVTDGYIGYCKGKGGLTEDCFSIYKSNGSSASSPILLEYNQLQGTTWTSGSGSGMMLGDGGGSNITAANNRLLTTGQAGIGVASGTNVRVLNNALYGAQRSNANVGIYVWNQSTSSCSGNEVSGNQVKWFNAGGAENPFYNNGNCGAVTQNGNNFHASLNPNDLVVNL